MEKPKKKIKLKSPQFSSFLNIYWSLSLLRQPNFILILKNWDFFFTFMRTNKAVCFKVISPWKAFDLDDLTDHLKTPRAQFDLTYPPLMNLANKIWLYHGVNHEVAPCVLKFETRCSIHVNLEYTAVLGTMAMMVLGSSKMHSKRHSQVGNPDSGQHILFISQQMLVWDLVRDQICSICHRFHISACGTLC